MDRKKKFYELMEVIYDVSDKINAYNNVPKQYGTDDFLSMLEAHTISIIGDREKISITEIAKAKHKTKGAVSQTIEKLSKKGMLTKDQHPTDKRLYVLNLTEKGKKVYNVHKEKDRIAFNRFLDRLEGYEEEDFNIVIDILSKIFKM